MQTFIQGGVAEDGSYITRFTTPYAAVPSSMRSATFTTYFYYHHYSLTAILISRFLIDLQEANLRIVKVDSDNPAYISSYPGNTLPSFVAVPGAATSALKSSAEHHIKSGVLDNGETSEANDVEDETLGVVIPSLDVEV